MLFWSSLGADAGLKSVVLLKVMRTRICVNLPIKETLLKQDLIEIYINNDMVQKYLEN